MVIAVEERSRTIPGLTGLRGVAALLVVLFHMTDGQTSIPIIQNGAIGVDVFFILSGFVMAYVYADKLDPTDFRGFLTFLRARVARIYPLHIFMLCSVGLVVVALPGFASAYPLSDRRFSSDAFVASILLIQNWGYWLPTCWNAPAWSLSAEWFAYLTFPVMLSLTQRWRTTTVPLLLAAASLASFVALMRLKGVSGPNVTGYPAMLRMAFEFACGCLLFRATANGLRPLPWFVDVGAASLLLVSVLCNQLIFLTLPAIGMIVLTVAQNAGWIARVLSLRPIVFLGKISFSMYMVHWTILQIKNAVLPTSVLSGPQLGLLNIALLSLILAVSTLTYRLIEVPTRAWGRGAGRAPRISSAITRPTPSQVLFPRSKS
jgi:peptidoglycan/LPS O-acetylase OafA/YrhL